MGKNKLKKWLMVFAAAFYYTIPVLVGFLILGSAYGVLMQKNGYGVLWSMLMSAIAFCGSMQFVAIPMLVSGVGPLQALLVSVMVNARHLFYGISMLDKYKGCGKTKGFLIYTLCDETFSISHEATPPKHVEKRDFYFAISLLNYLYWIAGTLIGSVVGSYITFNTKGLDFVLTALFVVLFIELMEDKSKRKSGFLGVVATIISLLIFGDKLIIPAMLIILFILLMGRSFLCQTQSKQ